MTSRRWLTIFISVLLAFAVLTGGLVVYLDPFFHYHGPLSGYYYTLSDQRYQNDGITRHFSYDAVITGTSMVENFRTSELDAALGTNAVKLPYPGATYREVSDNLQKAFATHDDVRYVLRALDLTHLIEDKDAMRTDMGEYPDYLYDNNPFNDVKYLFNYTVVFEHVLPMLARKIAGRPGGITSFDDYGWSGNDEYSAAKALSGIESFAPAPDQPGLTDEERQLVVDNIRTNVTNLARENPDTTFILFFPPYSAAWYGSILHEGTFQKYLEAEQTAAREMITCPNIRLFLFSSDTDITTEMNNYKDYAHYSPMVNSRILQEMTAALKKEKVSPYEVTADNVDSLFAAEAQIYENLDYDALLAQR